MGSFTFKWDHAATEVFVTGTFDNWGKTVQLDKKDGTLFEKHVQLPEAGEKIYYKFVVDGKWTTDPTAPQENDAAGNLNNVLKPEQIIKPHTSGAAIMSGVTPDSTTAGLANNVPVEKSVQGGMPGDFPETPLNEAKDFSVNPIPATAGAGNPVQLAPGEKVPDSGSLTSHTTTSNVHDDVSLARKDEGSQQTFGVAPLPATGGIGNPIQLQPGEKVPHSSKISANTVQSTVTTDRESYEKGGSATGFGAPVLPDVVTPQRERDQKGTGVLDLPPISKNMIPESSLPLGGDATSERDPGVTISSAAPTSTTAALAAKVPLEDKPATSAVPEVVKDSQAKAHVGPEAASSSEAVKEKGEVEQELLHKVHEQPAIAGGATTTNASNDEANDATAKGVPLAVQHSIGQAHQSPEAAGNREAVTEKAAVESELLHEVKKSQSSGEPAPTMGAVGQPTAAGVPGVVSESLQQAHQGPEAAANWEAVTEKRAVESELLREVKPDHSAGPPAPAKPAASSEPALQATKGTAQPPASGDVSPLSKDVQQPTVTTGVQEGKTDITSTPSKGASAASAPSASNPASSSKPSDNPTSKKEKRSSGFFGGTHGSSNDSPASTSTENKRKSGFFRKISEKLSGKK